MAWILVCKCCKFGVKKLLQFQIYRIFPRDYFLVAPYVSWVRHWRLLEDIFVSVGLFMTLFHCHRRRHGDEPLQAVDSWEGRCPNRADDRTSTGNRCHSRSVDLAKVRRFADIWAHIMASSYISGLFLIIYCSPLITACAHKFKVVHATANEGLCGLDTPDATHEGDVLAVCSSRCTLDYKCLYFNYRTPPNQNPVCQLFNSPPENTAVQSHCLPSAVGR